MNDLVCKNCHGSNFIKHGTYESSGSRYQKYICRDCGTSRHVKQYDNTQQGARVLILDIETLPAIGYFWRPWKTNISQDQIIKDWCMVTVAAKWLYSPDTKLFQLSPKEALERDDRRITEEIWKMVNSADVLIAHNGVKFDFPKLNNRFLIHEMNPPLPYQVIDTLKVAKKWLGFTMNKLDFINHTLGISPKLKTDFDLWKQCDQGDQVALNRMGEYNVRDVVCLEECYLKLRPWVRSHPNVGLFYDDDTERCPHCGSEKLIWRPEGHDEYYTTPVGKYPVFRCADCGAPGRSRFSALSISKRKSVVSPTAR